MEEKPVKINYLCDGRVKGCKKRICYRNRNGDSEPVCKHTKDINYAKNFYKPYEGANYWEQENSKSDKKNLRMLKITTICAIASAVVTLISISILCILH